MQLFGLCMAAAMLVLHLNDWQESGQHSPCAQTQVCSSTNLWVTSQSDKFTLLSVRLQPQRLMQ
jgi:hypothetical protein